MPLARCTIYMFRKALVLSYIFSVLSLLCSCGIYSSEYSFSSYQDGAEAGEVQVWTQEEAVERGIYFSVPTKYKSEPPPNRNCFYSMHASENGLVAIYNIPSNVADGAVLNIYDVNGEYQYSLQFWGGSGGTMIAMEWIGDTIVAYWARSETFTHFDLSGNILCVGEFSREFDKAYFPKLQREAHGASKPMADGTVIEARVSNVLEYPLAFRSKIVRIDPDGSETVIYRARLLESKGLFLTLFILIAVPLAVWIKYRQHVKKYGNTKSFWPDLGV